MVAEVVVFASTSDHLPQNALDRFIKITQIKLCQKLENFRHNETSRMIGCLLSYLLKKKMDLD